MHRARPGEGVDIDEVLGRALAGAVPVVLGLTGQVGAEDPGQEAGIALRRLILSGIGDELARAAEEGVVDDETARR
jgi:hypothetical protein